MIGRIGCLLVWAFVFSVPPSLFAQEYQLSRIAPRVSGDLPLAQPPGKRIILPVRPPITPPRGTSFHQFARAAGIIFSGTVTQIDRRGPKVGQWVETVAVTFHVENSIRGTAPGRQLTITQWIGLWSSGQRYRVGERVLLFLYPKSKLGLTSWVGGPLGHFAIDRTGQVLLTPQHLTAFQRDPVLGGKSHARFSDFALAVRQAHEEE